MAWKSGQAKVQKKINIAAKFSTGVVKCWYDQFETAKQAKKIVNLYDRLLLKNVFPSYSWINEQSGFTEALSMGNEVVIFHSTQDVPSPFPEREDFNNDVTV